jgi:hypothetical protein
MKSLVEDQLLWKSEDGINIIPPKFDGYTIKGRRDMIKKGDLFLHARLYPSIERGQRALNSHEGWRLDDITRDKEYFIYRPDCANRLPCNPNFASPLPLP